MSEPYIGQIMMFAGTFAPQGYLSCDGSLQSISAYDALYNLIGTTYGGDGQSTFALPDLRGRAPISVGQGPNLSNYVLGQMSGSESVTLTPNQMAIHSHPAATAGTGGKTNTPAANTIFGDQSGGAAPGGTTTVYVYAPNAPAAQTALAPSSISVTGGSQPHENRQPFVAIKYCIAVYGVYPTQS